MPGALAQLGLQLGGQLIGTGMGLMLEKHNDQRQINQQQRLQDQQIAGQKQMVDYNYNKQMQMWENTNYKAQMAQMQKAGLNPGLIYGMSGGGATTTGQATGNVTSGEAPHGGGEVIAMTQQAMGLQMMKAQIENLNADTQKKQVEATKTGGPDTKLTETQTASLAQGIQNQKAQQILTEIDTKLKSVEYDFNKDTQQNRESIINITLSQAIEQVKMLENDRIISDNTVQTKIAQIKQTLANSILQSLLTKAETAKTQAQTTLTQAETEQTKQLTQESIRRVINMVQDNMLKWEELDNEHRKIEMEQMKIEWDQSGLPKGVKDILEQIFLIPGGGAGKRAVVGFKY